MSDFSYLPLNETVAAAVRKYADAIIASARAFDPNTDVSVEYEIFAENTDHTERAPVGMVSSGFGVVTVFPNFKTNSASACVYNRGKVQYMRLEGFDDDVIDATPTLGKLVKQTKINVKGFGFFLTQDLGLESQKQFEQEQHE